MNLLTYLQKRVSRGLVRPRWLILLLALLAGLLVVGVNAQMSATSALLYAHVLVLAPFGMCATRTLWGDRASEELRALLGLGLASRRLALAHLGVFVIASALWFALCCVLCVSVLGAPDRVTTLGVALLSGVSYGAMFAWCTTFRYGSFLGLVTNVVLGQLPGLGMIAPFAHVDSLLGAERSSAAPVSEVASSLCLVALGIGFALLTVRRLTRLAT
jgi:hypothetical protein